MQDRIGNDGSLITGTMPGKEEHAAQQEGRARPAALPLTAPVLPPISEHELQQLVDTIADSRHASHVMLAYHILIPSHLAPLVSEAYTNERMASMVQCALPARK